MVVSHASHDHHSRNKLTKYQLLGQGSGVIRSIHRTLRTRMYQQQPTDPRQDTRNQPGGGGRPSKQLRDPVSGTMVVHKPVQPACQQQQPTQEELYQQQVQYYMHHQQQMLQQQHRMHHPGHVLLQQQQQLYQQQLHHHQLQQQQMYYQEMQRQQLYHQQQLQRSRARSNGQSSSRSAQSQSTRAIQQPQAVRSSDR